MAHRCDTGHFLPARTPSQVQPYLRHLPDGFWPSPSRPAMLAAVDAGLVGKEPHFKWFRAICLSQMDVETAYTFCLVMAQIRRATAAARVSCKLGQ